MGKRQNPETGRTLTTGELLASAHALADTSGPAILKHFRKALTIDNKAKGGRFDPVTQADRAAERAIRRQLKSLHPGHAILGEEEGMTEGTAPYTWVIDPIDGTRAFMTGMPLWGTLIGVTLQERSIVGVMDQPYIGERVWSKGGGTTWWRSADGRERRIKAASCARLEEARFMTTSPELFSEKQDVAVFERLRGKARLTRFGGDCYAYCLLAAGHVDVIAEVGLQSYDIVALVPIIEGAGGVVTDWNGNRPENGGRILACGDLKLHERLLKVIART
ncbi:MAG: histidinol-phosphatase [Hyphomicrobiaceae bacterium]